MLPEDWSYNSPTLGFVSAWPTGAGDDGFTPEGALGDGRFGAFGGTKWGMTVGKTQSVTLGVSVQVLLDKTIDEKKTLDDYIAKLIKEIPFGYNLRPECKIGDRIGREIKFPDKNNKTVILRAVIADNAIWSVQTTYLDDEKTISEKFINSFLVPESERGGRRSSTSRSRGRSLLQTLYFVPFSGPASDRNGMARRTAGGKGASLPLIARQRISFSSKSSMLVVFAEVHLRRPLGAVGQRRVLRRPGRSRPARAS